MWSQQNWHDFERALQFVALHMPTCMQQPMPKPTLSHCVRVGFLLQRNVFSANICMAGLLHDLLEDTPVTKHDIEQHCGSHVCELVVANTKQKGDDFETMLQRTLAEPGAFWIKGANLLDSFPWYTSTHNHAELTQYVVPQLRLWLQKAEETQTSSSLLRTIKSEFA